MYKPVDALELVRTVLVTALEPGLEPEVIQRNWELYAPPLRMDSLGFHRVIVGLERALGRPIDDEALAPLLMERVSDLCTLVEQLSAGAQHESG